MIFYIDCEEISSQLYPWGHRFFVHHHRLLGLACLHLLAQFAGSTCGFDVPVYFGP